MKSILLQIEHLEKKSMKFRSMGKNAVTYEDYAELHPATKKNRNDPMFTDEQQKSTPEKQPTQKTKTIKNQTSTQPSKNKPHTVSGNPETDHKISTYLSKMKEMVNQARSGGGKPPNFELCTISVPGTNLFCGGNKGIERKDMPQLKGKPSSGSKAELLEVGKDGEVSIEKPFVESLRSKGVKLTEKKVDAAHLKSTQNQLVGEKVVGMISALEKDPNNPNITAPIFVSRDGYVLDGHHRWAAVVGLNFETDEPVQMNVVEVDMDIDELVKYTNNFADEMGIKQKAAKLLRIAS